jgi:hypothetical protein
MSKAKAPLALPEATVVQVPALIRACRVAPPSCAVGVTVRLVTLYATDAV